MLQGWGGICTYKETSSGATGSENMESNRNPDLGSNENPFILCGIEFKDEACGTPAAKGRDRGRAGAPRMIPHRTESQTPVPTLAQTETPKITELPNYILKSNVFWPFRFVV